MHYFRITEIHPTVPLERQIATHLTKLIKRGELIPNTKLPAIRTLADLWDTNYFTVHRALSRLVGQGYVIMRPVKGTFVAPPRRALRRACLYIHLQFRPFSIFESFYLLLHIWISRKLLARGIEVVPFFDPRPFHKLHTAPLKLKQMAADGEIDAVFAIAIYPHHSAWLYNLELPIASLLLEQPDRKIEVDVADIARKVISLAIRFRRKRIGLLHMPINHQLHRREGDILYLELKKMGAQEGVEVIRPQGREYRPIDQKRDQLQQLQAIRCEELLLRKKKRIDMLFVYPDSFILAAADMLRKHCVRVPEEILVVAHRNAETNIYVPFPMTWMTVKVDDYANRLIQQIDCQIEGNDLRPDPIRVSIEHTAPRDESDVFMRRL